jgi:hypothetical protein
MSKIDDILDTWEIENDALPKFGNDASEKNLNR